MFNEALTFIKSMLVPRKIGRISFFVRLLLYLLVEDWIILNTQGEWWYLTSLITLGYFLRFIAVPRARDCGLPDWVVLLLIVPVVSFIPLSILLFSRTRLSQEILLDEPRISFKKNIWWIIGFFGFPWACFFLIWILNPQYEMKFFQQVEGNAYLGSIMLLTALVVSALTYPLGIQFQKLRLVQPRRWTTIAQMIGITFVSLVFSLIACSIIFLGPAAFTMIDQMKSVDQY